MTTSTTELLDLLADVRASIDLARLNRQASIDWVTPPPPPPSPEVIAALAEIDAEYAPMIAAAEAKAAELEEQIKAAVIEGGASVKSAHLHAVYTPPRVTWDGKKLEGMAALIPGLEAARKVGQPSVSIRPV